ncbi:hypothetical protein [Glutamicibacter sp.]|uniref:hypothetical protein n=1 Tax=Glutamicibacter sp. TaxID=1931995 RepID=UPI003D6B323A
MRTVRGFKANSPQRLVHLAELASNRWPSSHQPIPWERIMNASTLTQPATEVQTGTTTRRVAVTREPRNHWAWTGWMPEDELGTSMLAA